MGRPVDLGEADPRPYIRMAARLRRQILAGEVAPGQPVPSLTTLSREFGTRVRRAARPRHNKRSTASISHTHPPYITMIILLTPILHPIFRCPNRMRYYQPLCRPPTVAPYHAAVPVRYEPHASSACHRSLPPACVYFSVVVAPVTLVSPPRCGLRLPVSLVAACSRLPVCAGLRAGARGRSCGLRGWSLWRVAVRFALAAGASLRPWVRAVVSCACWLPVRLRVLLWPAAARFAAFPAPCLLSLSGLLGGCAALLLALARPGLGFPSSRRSAAFVRRSPRPRPTSCALAAAARPPSSSGGSALPAALPRGVRSVRSWSLPRGRGPGSRGVLSLACSAASCSARPTVRRAVPVAASSLSTCGPIALSRSWPDPRRGRSPGRPVRPSASGRVAPRRPVRSGAVLPLDLLSRRRVRRLVLRLRVHHLRLALRARRSSWSTPLIN